MHLLPYSALLKPAFLLLLLFVTPSHAGVDDIQLRFYPEGGLLVPEGSNATFSFTVESNSSSAVQLLSASLTIPDEETQGLDIANLRLPDLDFGGAEAGDGQNFSVEVEGVFVGKTDVHFVLETSEGRKELTYYVGVLRSAAASSLTNVFVISITIVIFVNGILMGMQMDYRVIWELVKRPIAPVIGVLCQWGCMAPLAYFWGWLFLNDTAQQLSLFLIGSCPGGGQSNKFTLLLDGNLNLSITMTFVSNIMSLGMTPMWVYTLGATLTERMGIGGKALTIPYTNILTSLATAIAPAIIGMAIRHFRPQWAPKTLKFVKVSSFLIVIIIIPFGFATNMYVVYYMSLRILGATFCLPFSGFLLGLAAGYVSHIPSWQPPVSKAYPDAIALAVETAIQNSQMAMLILRFALPEPDRDLVIPVSVAFMLLSSQPLWSVAVETAIQNSQMAMLILRFALPEPDRDLVIPVSVAFMLLSSQPLWLILAVRLGYKCVDRRRHPEKYAHEVKAPPGPLKRLLAKLRERLAKGKADKVAASESPEMTFKASDGRAEFVPPRSGLGRSEDDAIVASLPN